MAAAGLAVMLFTQPQKAAGLQLVQLLVIMVISTSWTASWKCPPLVQHLLQWVIDLASWTFRT